MEDRFGIGWRPELAAGILSHLARIDVVEVIAEEYLDARGQELRALRTLAKQVPVLVHGVSLGLASAIPVEIARLDKMARLVEAVRPEGWSEHLAFVRGGGIEIGHLAAPPRTAATVAGAARNLALARAIVGAAPLVENVATLIDPPGSDCDEADWTTDILSVSGGDFLLDLHNLYANAINFGFDAGEYLARIPAERIAGIHLAGGRWIYGSESNRREGRRLLDDHLHDVPAAVFDLLSVVGAKTGRPLTVILERDGQYPPIEDLLDQLERARRALQHGRMRRGGVGEKAA